MTSINSVPLLFTAASFYPETYLTFANGVMDLKGQRKCERLFLQIMWPATAVSCVAGFVADDVLAIFKVFGASLVVSSVLCLPNWPMFNKNPIKFAGSSD